MKLFTMEDIHNALGDCTFPQEWAQQISDALNAYYDRETTAQITAELIERTEKNATPEDKAVMENWSPADRLLWQIKEAIIYGWLKGTETTLESMRIGMQELEHR